MSWCEHCAVIIPCLNEEASIAELVKSVRAIVKTVIVVDDGSSDKTAALAQEAGARVLVHACNQGKGVALKTGLQFALEHGFECALTMDGDHQHCPAEIPKFFACAEASKAALVVGNRMSESESIPLVRRYVNWWMSRRISSLAGIPIPDSQCGFRLMRLRRWAELDIQADRFQIESDTVLAFSRAGLVVEFVSVKAIPSSRPSRIRPLQDTWRWLAWWCARSFGPQAALKLASNPVEAK